MEGRGGGGEDMLVGFRRRLRELKLGTLMWQKEEVEEEGRGSRVWGMLKREGVGWETREDLMATQARFRAKLGM